MPITLLITISAIVGFVMSLLAITANVMAMRLVAKKEMTQAIFFGIGNSIPQVAWGAIAGVSLYNVSHLITRPIDIGLTIFGIVIMLIIAYKLFTEKEHHFKKHPLDQPPSVFKNLFIGFMLALSAPEKVIVYIIIFTSFGVHYTSHTFLKTVICLTIGTAIGAALLWALLLNIFKHLSKSIEARQLTRAGAILLVLMSCVAFIGLFIK